MASPIWQKNEHEDNYDPNDPIPEWEAAWMLRELGSSIMTPDMIIEAGT